MHNITAASLLVFALFVLSAMSLRALLTKTTVPPLVGFLLLGVLASALDGRYEFLTGGTRTVMSFLEQLGVAVILFRVGLESNLRGLLAQLQRASYVWVVNVGIAMAGGYLVARYGLGWDLVASLYVMVAFAATSVGITVAVWQQEDKLRTEAGELLVDVAELDDISSVIFMVILFGLTPALTATAGGSVGTAGAAGSAAVDLALLWQEAWPLLLSLAAFLAGAAVFSMFIEKPVTSFFRSMERAPSFMITVLALGLIIASLAGIVGFSLAIGAFFAGLIFSRDPQAVHVDARFEDLYELFAPFFFIGLGLAIEIEALVPALGAGLLLTLVAVVSKVVGAGLPVLGFRPWREALAVGLSMAARAEIAMLVMQRGQAEGLIPAEVYGAMIVVVILTASLAPLAARPLIRAVSRE
ncbi:MAG: cation:proton antiporter [Spiribacter salinus]|uniref:Cation:proton antiporter n=1 Tax=Spiribacter salinus TaxID=1335746 RepID=A0A540VIU2_9GAMM|nr:MAG: cation:proton antiporter [Spiribacter salinus]